MSAVTLDQAILAALPANCRVLSVEQHGKTNWSTGLRIEVDIDGKKHRYFAKIVEKEDYVGMSQAEYEGQLALAHYIPDNIVTPLAWGFLERGSCESFFLARFCDLDDNLPPISEILAIVKKLHSSSVSPTGKFGFHTTTYYGPPPMINDWTDDWEEYFTRQFRADLVYAQRERGEDPELQDLAEKFIRKVIPRLLRPLQTGGRNIKPTLCHGDLWDGNIQVDVETKQPILFDSCCFYGHNEMDLQCMGGPRYTLGMDFIRLYKDEIGASEPEEDFYDRHALYAIRNNICTAGMWPQWTSLLTSAKEEMRRLLSRYPDGLDGFKEESTGEEPARKASTFNYPEVTI
ncbi:Fructosamine kinase-domain-containing protein [Hypoxylon sp. FL0543]|nr:Fructosamine kinase-domain-containing protein [Hypoxylon sp. FL0543]